MLTTLKILSLKKKKNNKDSNLKSVEHKLEFWAKVM